MGADEMYACGWFLSSGTMSAETLRMMSTPPVLISAICVATSGTARNTRVLNGGLPRQCWSKASRRIIWSRFHSTNFHGPVPTAAVVPKVWSPTVSMCFLGTMGKNTSRSRRSGNGLSEMMCTVSGFTIRTSLMARMLPYWGDFFVWSSTRSNEYFTSSALMVSPLWNLTPFRILNSHCVSESGFQEVARDGSNSSLVFRWRSESNMLMLTRIPTRSKCMCGSRVGECATSATTSVSLVWADASGGAAASAASNSMVASTIHLFMRTRPPSRVGCGRSRGRRWPHCLAGAYTIEARFSNAGGGRWVPEAQREESDGQNGRRHGEHGPRGDATARRGNAPRNAAGIVLARRSPGGSGRHRRARQSHGYRAGWHPRGRGGRGHGLGLHDNPGRRRVLHDARGEGELPPSRVGRAAGGPG